MFLHDLVPSSYDTFSNCPPNVNSGCQLSMVKSIQFNPFSKYSDALKEGKKFTVSIYKSTNDPKRIILRVKPKKKRRLVPKVCPYKTMLEVRPIRNLSWLNKYPLVASKWKSSFIRFRTYSYSKGLPYVLLIL